MRLVDGQYVAEVELDGGKVGRHIQKPHAREHGIVAVVNGKHGAHVAVADEVVGIVGDDISLITPFVAKQVNEQFTACTAPVRTQTVIRGHNAVAGGFLDGNFKGFEINFTHRLFVSPCEDTCAVCFLIVHHKVLEADTACSERNICTAGQGYFQKL